MAVDADYFDGRQKEDASAVIKVRSKAAMHFCSFSSLIDQQGHIYGVHDAIEADKLDSDHCNPNHLHLKVGGALSR